MVRLRSFLDTRPSKSLLKKKGILRERVFGCDIGELLHRTGEDGMFVSINTVLHQRLLVRCYLYLPFVSYEVETHCTSI